MARGELLSRGRQAAAPPGHIAGQPPPESWAKCSPCIEQTNPTRIGFEAKAFHDREHMCRWREIEMQPAVLLDRQLVKEYGLRAVGRAHIPGREIGARNT